MIAVRLAEDEDRRPLAELFAAVAEERDGIAAEPPIDLEKWAARWELDRTFVAVEEGEIAGCLTVHDSPFGYAEIGMEVAADKRRRGVGSALVAGTCAVRAASSGTSSRWGCSSRRRARLPPPPLRARTTTRDPC